MGRITIEKKKKKRQQIYISITVEVEKHVVFVDCFYV